MTHSVFAVVAVEQAEHPARVGRRCSRLGATGVDESSHHQARDRRSAGIEERTGDHGALADPGLPLEVALGFEGVARASAVGRHGHCGERGERESVEREATVAVGAHAADRETWCAVRLPIVAGDRRDLRVGHRGIAAVQDAALHASAAGQS